MDTSPRACQQYQPSVACLKLLCRGISTPTHESGMGMGGWTIPCPLDLHHWNELQKFNVSMGQPNDDELPMQSVKNLSRLAMGHSLIQHVDYQPWYCMLERKMPSLGFRLLSQPHFVGCVLSQANCQIMHIKFCIQLNFSNYKALYSPCQRGLHAELVTRNILPCTIPK